MVLDLSFVSIMPFITIISLFVIYSILDIRHRRVRNEFIIGGLVAGFIILLFTGHLITNLILHVVTLLIILPLAYILFRIGSIGGADAKSLFIVSLISPGIELGIMDEPILEAIIGIGGELIVMLLGGYLYWRVRGDKDGETTPLIPFLLMGYIAVQAIALF